tara:strand:- start:397 stop:636 length:240 start_codon:yes stop_codon:yes gene_type:complete
MENRRINGWDFEFVKQSQFYDQFYQCRGEVVYDDDHDETPEPSLWRAALELKKELLSEGFGSEVCHSEKGWVEVSVKKQ